MSNEDGSDRISYSAQFAAGGISGIAGLCIGHPMDTVKIIQQNTTKQNLRAIDAMRLVNKQGFKTFFNGMGLVVYSYAFVNAIVFTSFKAFSEKFENMGLGRIPSTCSAGFITGIVQSFAASPVEVIKVQRQNQVLGIDSDRISTRQVAKNIYKNEGIRGFYRGIQMFSLRDSLSFSVYFLIYEEMGFLLNSDSLTSTFLSGATAGVTSWLATMPIDIVKTRIQTKQETNAIECVKNLILKDGIKGLMRGTGITLIRAFFVNAVSFGVYEESLLYFASPPAKASKPTS